MHLIWGFIGLKAFLHHHLLDYAKTLACKGKYGYYVKKLKSPSIALGPILHFVLKTLDGILKDFSIVREVKSTDEAS